MTIHGVRDSGVFYCVRNFISEFDRKKVRLHFPNLSSLHGFDSLRDLRAFEGDTELSEIEKIIVTSVHTQLLRLQTKMRIDMKKIFIHHIETSEAYFSPDSSEWHGKIHLDQDGVRVRRIVVCIYENPVSTLFSMENSSVKEKPLYRCEPFEIGDATYFDAARRYHAIPDEAYKERHVIQIRLEWDTNEEDDDFFWEREATALREAWDVDENFVQAGPTIAPEDIPESSEAAGVEIFKALARVHGKLE